MLGRGVVVKVVAGHGFTTRDLEELENDLKKYLGSAIRCRIEMVEEITRGSNGKFRQIVSTVAANKFGA